MTVSDAASATLQTIPSIALDHTLHNLAPSCQTDGPAFAPQIRFPDGMNQVAFDQCFPIETVGGIHQDLSGIR